MAGERVAADVERDDAVLHHVRPVAGFPEAHRSAERGGRPRDHADEPFVGIRFQPVPEAELPVRIRVAGEAVRIDVRLDPRVFGVEVDVVDAGGVREVRPPLPPELVAPPTGAEFREVDVVDQERPEELVPGRREELDVERHQRVVPVPERMFRRF